MSFFKSVKGVSLAVLLAATVITSPALADRMHPQTGEKLAEEQVFNYRILDEIPTLDPQLMEDVSGFDAARNLFEGLLSQDADGKLIPGVAESWEANDTNTTYTFHLRSDAKWSNGDPVTAGDFVYSWQRSMDPKLASPYSWYMEMMSIENASDVLAGDKNKSELGVTAIDDQTLEVRLTRSLPYFASMTTLATAFPVHQASVEKFGQDWTDPGNMISNGAYMLSERVSNEKIAMVRNPNYWDNANTIIDTIVGHVINDENQAFTRYLAGELDVTAVPSGQFIRLKAERPDETLSLPYLGSYYYSFNLADSGPEAFKDVRVRKALSYAIDRSVITEQILQGGQVEAYNIVPHATAGFVAPEIDYGTWTQDERDEKARALLAEAGYSAENPLEFDLLYNTDEGHKKIATAVSQMWAQKLGVKAQLLNMEWKTMLETARNDAFDMVRYAWIGDYNEASTFLDLYVTDGAQNWSNYSNPEVDQLLQDAKVAADPNPMYTKIEQILADDMPVVPLYHYTSVIMKNPAIHGWPMNNIQQAWYGRALYKTAE